MAGLRAIRGLQQGEEEPQDSGSVSEEVYQKVLPLTAARRKRIQSEKLAGLTLTVRNSWPTLPNARSQPYELEPDATRKKRVVSAKSLANLRPNPQHLKPHGGQHAHQYVTSPELDFLNYVLDGASKTDAARWAGLSKGINLTSLMRRPLIDQTLAELQEKRKHQSIEAAERRREERAEFLHQELMHRLRTAVTHERTGDLAIAKMLEVGFKSTGEIAAKSVTATASATAQANVTAEIDIYKPLWLRESEAQMLAESRKRLLGPATPPEAGKGRKITRE
jgi:hypothetical protein